MPSLAETSNGLYESIRHLMMNLYGHMSELLLDCSKPILT